MAAHIENALKKIIDATQDFDKNKRASTCSHVKYPLFDRDLSNYEQLVIMKKYPYLDLKELDFNYHPPSNKNARQSIESGSHLGEESSFCESVEEAPNVEIINRGLTGFAIPIKLAKIPKTETKPQLETLQKAIDIKTTKTDAFLKKSSDESLLVNLEEEIMKFEEQLKR